MSANAHTLIGAYVLHAVTDTERDEVEAHLSECPDCAAEAQELRATAARLAVAVAEQPPDELRRRVLAQVGTTRQQLPIPSQATRARPIGDRRIPGSRRLTALAAAASLLVAVVLAGVTLYDRQQLGSVQAQLAMAQRQYTAVAEVAQAPDAHTSNGSGAGGETAVVLRSRQLDRAVLLVSDLPAPPADHRYQAWLLGSGQPRSAGLLATTSGATTAPLALSSVGAARKVGLTVEPEAGSPQPTTNPLLVFDLPA